LYFSVLFSNFPNSTKKYTFGFYFLSHMTYTIDRNDVDISTIVSLSMSNTKLTLSAGLQDRINQNRDYLDTKINNTDIAFYGINTGFGSLCNVVIDKSSLAKLQKNLVLSHACGMGSEVPRDIVRLIFLLKIINLSKGNSGIRLQLLQHMVDVYNAGITPVMFTQGSLGASGDLAPLAHLSCTLIGYGDAIDQSGNKIPAHQALKEALLNPIELAAKEGIALLNGTQFSLAYAMFVVHNTHLFWPVMTKITALSAEGFACDISPFNKLLHNIRPHSGQLKVAADMHALLSNSEMRTIDKVSVQDPYSFRCIPQVHGASWGVLQHVTDVVQIELNSVTDNPMVFDEDDVILSGGNFHAQPLALALDYLAIGLAELASISERRTYQLINGERGLTPFLTPNAGLNSGYMIAQYTAASIVSQNKQLCTPASVDSIVSSKGQEDHVSMAANAATKCIQVWDNLLSVVAIEWNVAAQAVDQRMPIRLNTEVESCHKSIRKVVQKLEEDRLLQDDLKATRELIISLLK
jgi:histidine ammonia-lyase